MGMFGDLMNKIFHHAGAAERPADAWAGAQVSSSASTAATASTAAAPAAVAQEPVDVTAALDKLASENGEKLDWKKSIVDLMKLVGMDSDLASRRELAADLHYAGDTADTATMNMWLHKEVLSRMAANGGNVPAGLLAH